MVEDVGGQGEEGAEGRFGFRFASLRDEVVAEKLVGIDKVIGCQKNGSIAVWAARYQYYVHVSQE